MDEIVVKMLLLLEQSLIMHFTGLNTGGRQRRFRYVQYFGWNNMWEEGLWVFSPILISVREGLGHMPYKPKRYPWQPCKGEQSQMQVLTCIVRQNSFSGKTYLNMITYPVRQVILQYKAMGLLHMEWFIMQDRRSAAAIGVQKNCQSSHLCFVYVKLWNSVWITFRHIFSEVFDFQKYWFIYCI